MRRISEEPFMIQLSVIVPVYNINKDYLQKCFSSLSKQNMKDIEFIVINDGSLTQCAALCDEFGLHEPRARIIHQENSGVSAARNKGLEVATGKYILFVDADDSLLVDSCEKLCELMDSNDYDIIFFKYVNESQKLTVTSYNDTISINDFPQEKIHELCGNIISRSQDCDHYTLGAPWGKIFRRLFIETNKLRFIVDLKKAQDRVFMLDSLIRNPRIAFTNLFIYCYNNINSESVCHKFNPNILNTLELVDSEMVRIINNHATNRNSFMMCIYKMRLQNILEYVHLYEFHPDNKDLRRTKAERLKRIISRNIYSTALENVTFKELGDFDKQRKIKLLILKHKWVNLYVVLSSIGNRVKGDS
jgi:glycosyltransferase involved in cell wall biosynthesis